MTYAQRLGLGRGWFLAVAISWTAGCAIATPANEEPETADPMALTWVSPGTSDRIEVGDAIELAVMTQNPDAHVVHFSLDGREIGACGSADSDTQDCRVGDRWRWTTTIATTGSHRLEAWFEPSSAARVHAEITVQADAAIPNVDPDAGIDDDAGPIEETELFALDAEVPIADGGMADAHFADARFTDVHVVDVHIVDAHVADTGVHDAGQAATPPPPPPSRGFLDPDRAFHSSFGGIEWAVHGQSIDLRSTDPSGSTSAIASCMARYGASIRRWGDHYRISRGSIVATAMTESNCTDPPGSSDGLSSGPMQVTASTCAAVMGISASTCGRRMYTNPDFSFEVGVRYMASSYQLRQHGHDPPKIAAAYNAGSLRSSSANRWHLLVTGNHIDRFVNAYNAYRAWERRSGLGVEFAPEEMFFAGEHVATVSELPSGVRDGQTYFVGDWSHRDGEFYLFFNGAWQRSVP